MVGNCSELSGWSSLWNSPELMRYTSGIALKLRSDCYEIDAGGKVRNCSETADNITPMSHQKSNKNLVELHWVCFKMSSKHVPLLVLHSSYCYVSKFRIDVGPMWICLETRHRVCSRLLRDNVENLGSRSRWKWLGNCTVLPRRPFPSLVLTVRGILLLKLSQINQELLWSSSATALQPLCNRSATALKQLWNSSGGALKPPWNCSVDRAKSLLLKGTKQRREQWLETHACDQLTSVTHWRPVVSYLLLSCQKCHADANWFANGQPPFPSRFLGQKVLSTLAAFPVDIQVSDSSSITWPFSSVWSLDYTVGF